MGKTALVKYLADSLGFKIVTIDIHAGVKEEDIVQKINEISQRANAGDL